MFTVLPGSLAVPPLAGGVVAQGAEEVDFTQVGSECLDEVELAVRALPEHEVAQPLLTGGAHDEVRIRLALRVEVLGDQFGGEDLGEIVDGATAVAVGAHDL